MSKSMPLQTPGKLLALATAALPCSALAGPHDSSRIEAAPSGQAYDYVVHVPNTYDYRYNPEAREDRVAVAKHAVRQFCSKSQIIGENKFKTEIFGLITGKPDYVVYVKCG